MLQKDLGRERSGSPDGPVEVVATFGRVRERLDVLVR